MLMVWAWENGMGAMAKKLETWHGSHGKRATMAKSAMEKCHGTYGKQAMTPPERNPVRVARCFTVMIHHDDA